MSYVTTLKGALGAKDETRNARIFPHAHFRVWFFSERYYFYVMYSMTELGWSRLVHQIISNM